MESPKDLSREEKLLYSYTMGFYTATKKSIIMRVLIK